MPINAGDSKATVKSKIDAIITTAGLSAAGNTDTTAATTLLNQVAVLYGLPGLANGMTGAAARGVINTLEAGGEALSGLLHYAADGATWLFHGATTPAGRYDATTNKSWFCWEAYDGPPRRVNIRVYDHTAEAWSQIYTAGFSKLADDDHGVPSLVRDHQGYWYVFYGPHNGDMRVAATASADDPSFWIERENIPGFYTYPHPSSVGDDIYMFARKWDGVSTDMPYMLRKSSDVSGGNPTWATEAEIINLGADSRCYSGQHIVVGTDIHITMTRANYPDTERRHVYYFVYDTLTGDVRNYADTTTIAVGDLPVDLTDANASYRIYEHSGSDWGMIPGLCMDSDGNPHIVFDNGQPSEFDLLHMMHNGSAWTAPESVGGTITFRNDTPSIASEGDGKVRVYWPEDVSDSYVRGGSIRMRTRNADGSWGSIQTVLNPQRSYPLDGGTVNGGHPDLLAIFGEITQDSTAESGELRGYAHGVSGFLKSQPDTVFKYWSPRDLGTKLQRWFQVRDESTIREAGGVGLGVSSIAGRVTAEPAPGQATAARRPLWSRTALAGQRHGMIFDGVDDHIAAAMPAGLANPSVYLVAQRGTQSDAFTGSGARTIFIAPRSDGNRSFSLAVRRPSADATQEIVALQGDGAGSTNVTLTGFGLGARAVFGIRTSGDDMFLRRDGGTETSAAKFGANTTFSYSFGGDLNTIGRNFAGVISEIVMTDGSETTDERQKLEGYLAWEAGMQGQLPDGHPYKSSRPAA